MIHYGFELMVRPRKGWQTIAELPDSLIKALALYPFFLAAFPTLAWYFGTTQVGWTVGSSNVVTRLTQVSAIEISLMFYIAMVLAVAIIGYSIHWMSETYGAESTVPRGIVVSALACTPLFLAGTVGIYPLLWLDFFVGVIALCWAVYLLYLGIPIVMHIPQERGFLFSSAIIAIALVMFVCILVVTILLWDYGFAPQFTDQ